MHIKHFASALALMAMLFVTSTVLLAHAGMEHVMGTVTAVSDKSITVDTVKHTKVTVSVDASTKFANGNNQTSISTLKVGDRVVIHAKKNHDNSLVAAEVKWGASAATPAASMDKMEGMDHKH